MTKENFIARHPYVFNHQSYAALVLLLVEARRGEARRDVDCAIFRVSNLEMACRFLWRLRYTSDVAGGDGDGDGDRAP